MSGFSNGFLSSAFGTEEDSSVGMRGMGGPRRITDREKKTPETVEDHTRDEFNFDKWVTILKRIEDDKQKEPEIQETIIEPDLQLLRDLEQNIAASRYKFGVLKELTQHRKKHPEKLSFIKSLHKK